MSNQRLRMILLLLAILFLLIVAFLFLRPRLPVITGYAAKNMCSCVFVSGRTPDSVARNDLSFFPLNLADTQVDWEKRTVTSTIFGLAARKAVYREGLGCTLLIHTSESALRQQAAGYDPPPVVASGPDSAFWPVGKRVAPLPQQVDGGRLNAAIQSAFEAPQEGTRAVVVIYRGELIAENYADGFDAATPQLGWSMTKSITNALVGILVKEGKLDLDQPVAFSRWQDDERQDITLDNLLRMTSGLRWNEAYGGLSDATRMLYQEENMADYAIRRPLEADPGSEWVYSSGTTNILSFIIRREMDSLFDYWSFPRKALFNPLGMTSAVIEPDASGTFVGSSYGYATPRDWARFGLLYLNEGVWQGQRILPEGWEQYTRETTPASHGEYGAQFWLNEAGTLPDVPADTYACQGFQGQRIFIIPSREAVIVRIGLSDEEAFDFNHFVAGILSALPQG